MLNSNLTASHRDGELTAIGEWIRKNIRKSRSIYRKRTSYGLKHELVHDTGIYLTNEEFKEDMVLAGFLPVNPDVVNCTYRIELVREKNINPSPFFAWTAEQFAKQNSPEGDFARDMLGDFEFPVFADRDIIRRYLERNGACDSALAAFEKIWSAYERA